MHQTVSKKLNLTFVCFKNSGVSGKLSRLVLGSLTIADEGEYKCRVDYSQAPTKIDSVTLSILGEQNSALLLQLNKIKDQRSYLIFCIVIVSQCLRHLQSSMMIMTSPCRPWWAHSTSAPILV